MFTKVVILFMLLLIVASLGFALRYLLMDRERSPRTVKALTARIGMSLVLFFMLIAGYQAGILHPHGLKASANATKVASDGGRENSR